MHTRVKYSLPRVSGVWHEGDTIPRELFRRQSGRCNGNICVQSLIDLKDVQLRNFARPVQAVTLSPECKRDRTYLSGGLAGLLVLTVGAPNGRSTAMAAGATAQAAGWLDRSLRNSAKIAQ